MLRYHSTRYHSRLPIQTPFAQCDPSVARLRARPNFERIRDSNECDNCAGTSPGNPPPRHLCFDEDAKCDITSITGKLFFSGVRSQRRSTGGAAELRADPRQRPPVGVQLFGRVGLRWALATSIYQYIISYHIISYHIILYHIILYICRLIYTPTYMCIYIYIHIHMCIYTYTYIHTYGYHYH